MDKNREGGRMIDKVTFIENKIHELKKRKERIQTQQALLLIKEAQKILKDEFSPDVALKILKDCWNNASEAQKEEWTTRAGSFPIHSPKTHQKAKKHTSTHEQSGKTEMPHHDHA